MKRTALLGLLALVSWSAQAAQVPGWRIGAAVSFADFEGDEQPGVPLPDNFIEDNAVGFKLYGQYQFSSWFGIEGAYHNTSEFEDRTDDGKLKLSFDGFSLQGLLYVPMPSEEIQLYVKGGYYDFDDELALGDTTLSTSSESGLVVGAGASLAIAERIGIRMEYERFDAEVGDLWGVNLGVEYYFGGSKEAAPAVAPPPPPPPPPSPEPAAEPTAVAPAPAETGAESSAEASPPAEAGAEPPTAVDSDGDGVTDENDECPTSSPGAQVNNQGCQG
jgi:opacity protein-like surface antigen